MEINKKVFNSILPQIKAYKNVVVLKDSLEDEHLEILYVPKMRDLTPGHIIRMTVPLAEKQNLFDETPVEKLGNPVFVYLPILRDVSRIAKGDCVLKDGHLNGVSVQIDSEDFSGTSVANFIMSSFEASKKVWQSVQKKDLTTLALEKDDYTFIVSECGKFVNTDVSRYFMNGVCFDFPEVAGMLNIVATDGRRMCICALNEPHPGIPKSDRHERQFIVPLSALTLPSSEYSKVNIKFSSRYCQINISTEDYNIESYGVLIDGQFPNWERVIPTDATQWIQFCTNSLKPTVSSLKEYFAEGTMYIDASNPEDMYITDGKDIQAKVEGSVSCPMRLKMNWKYLFSCLLDEKPFTRFYLKSARSSALMMQDSKPAKNVSLAVTKIFMPMMNDDCSGENYDTFGIPKITLEEA